MEKWLDRFSDIIPYNAYEYGMSIKSGEEDGLVIKLERLENEKEIVVIDFFTTKAMRVVDEGLYLADEVFLEEEIQKYKQTEFESVIYEIKDGEFGNFIKRTSSGIYDYLNMKHYIIITLNFVIEIISVSDPEIRVENN